MKTLTISDFTGGRNTQSTAPALKSNESSNQKNTWTENGALIKRKGWTSIIAGGTNFTPFNILKMISTNLGTAGAERLVMMCCVTPGGIARIFYTDNATTFIYSQSGFDPSDPGMGKLFNTKIPFMGMFGTKLYVSDGLNPAVSYDGTTLTWITAFPRSVICAIHKNYIFAAKASILSWCEINNATTWPINNFQSVNSEDGNNITGLSSWGGNLVIFKQHSMHILVGNTFDPIDANYYIQKIETPPGFNFFFKETIVVHNGVLKFLTTDGFYSYSGGNQIVKISDPIQPDIDILSYLSLAMDGENNTRTPRSYVWKNVMYCSIISNSLRIWFVQDAKNKWWVNEDDYGSSENTTIQMLSSTLDGANTPKLYGAGVPALFLTMDTGNDTQAFIGNTAYAYPIESYWTSKTFSLPSEVIMKYIDVYVKKQTATTGGRGSITFSFSIDGATNIDKTITMLAGTGTILKKRVPVERIGRSINFKIYNFEQGVTFEIYQISLTYELCDATRS